jgi:hypothetical protein
MGMSSYEREYSDEDIVINADGTITRKHLASSDSSQPSEGGSPSNTNPIKFVMFIICVIVGVLIYEYVGEKPRAHIERIWVDYNEYQNGEDGMNIHVKFTVNNLLDEDVDVYVYFYQGNNLTPLHDRYGDNVYFFETTSVNYKSSIFNDFDIFIPYSWLDIASGTSGYFSFDISVKHSGNQLDRDRNNRFYFTSD